MCGIAGIAHKFQPAPQYRFSIEAMTDALRHRGPDGSGTNVVNPFAPSVLFGHRRLAIIDLSAAGHQPMVDPDNGNWITFNGEIYNYRELRGELVSLGYTFTTETDTEVILKSYAAWGPKFLDRLRGIFAFGIWDMRERVLLLARDQLGVKPLYYWNAGEQFLFASEVRALLASDLIPRRLDVEALTSYLAYGSVQEPFTLVQGIKSLLPGHNLTYKDGSLSVSRYWSLPDPSLAAHNIPSHAASETAERLSEAIRLQLVSDVPLGAFLSGGIDSTAIAALAQRAAQLPLKTFSIVFEETKYDERVYSRKAAEHIGTDHAELHLTGEMVRTALPTAVNSFDQPSIDGLNTYFVSQVTRQAGLTVALSGVGGDEVFGGYGGYAKALLFEKWGRRLALMPSGLRSITAHILNASGSRESLRQLARLCRHPEQHYFLTRQVFDESQISALLESEEVRAPMPDRFKQLAFETADYDPINRTSALELQTYMLSTLLRDTDQMSMAHALEIRVPLIDHKLVEFLFTLPGDCKLDRATPKPLLTRGLNGAIPSECINRPKRGFELPFAVWLRASLEGEVRNTLLDSSVYQMAPFKRSGLAKLWRDFEARRLNWSRVWGVFVLIKWLERHRVTVC